MHYDVVIAGGGFAGAYCAKTLGKLLGPGGEKRVALIAECNVLVFQPMLAEVVGSTLKPVDVVNPLRQFCRHVDVLQGGIRHIDWKSRTLRLDGGRFTRDHEIGFGQLVLTLGSVTDLSRVPGMSEYGRPLKSVADALRLRSTLINRLEEANLVADVETRDSLLTFVVVGGGYTGVEVAGQVRDFLQGSLRFYANLRESSVRVVLVHSHGQLLSEIGPELGEHAARVLIKRGLELRLNTRVVEVTASQVLLNNGDPIAAHTVITTIGNAPNPVVLDLCRQLSIETDRGRVPAEATMRVTGHPDLWTAGDCAAVPWNDRGTLKTAPPNAQIALRQGVQLAHNLHRVLTGGQPQPFTYRYLGQMATIGEHDAVAEILGFHFSGFIAWWLWRTVYLAKLPGFARKLRVMIEWSFELVFPRDLSLVQPPPEDILRPIHLGTDEILFQRGHACTSYFLLRRGRLRLTAPDKPTRELTAGAVIAQNESDDDEAYWLYDAVALESSDLMVFRGTALKLMQNELRLEPRRPEDGHPKAS